MIKRRKKCVFNERLCRNCGCLYLADETKIDPIEKGIKMRKIIIDENACVGCGMCVMSLPHVFEIGKDSISKVKDQNHMDIELKLEVAASCPVSAITIED